MAKKKEWIAISQDAVAKFFQRDRRTVQIWLRKGAPGRSGHYDLSKLCRWRENQLTQRQTRDDDALLVGGDVYPALERYREERAKLARYDRLEREGQLTSRHEIRQGLSLVASLLRDAGSRLIQQYGAGAGEILHEALDEAQHVIQREFGPAQPDGPTSARETARNTAHSWPFA